MKDELACQDYLDEVVHKSSKHIINADSKMFHKVRLAQDAPIYWKSRCG